MESMQKAQKLAEEEFKTKINQKENEMNQILKKKLQEKDELLKK